jgi:hypothetical protein
MVDQIKKIYFAGNTVGRKALDFSVLQVRNRCSKWLKGLAEGRFGLRNGSFNQAKNIFGG